VILLRRLLGEVLRGQRLRQDRTLREVSSAARVSLGYLSEVERGRKEASSELLASICDALGVPLSAVLREVSDGLARTEGVPGRPLPVLGRLGADHLAIGTTDDPADALAPTGRREAVGAPARVSAAA